MIALGSLSQEILLLFDECIHLFNDILDRWPFKLLLEIVHEKTLIFSEAHYSHF